MEKYTNYDELQAQEIQEISSKPKAPAAFEEVLEYIGPRGKFQTRLTVIFICLAACFDLMSVNLFYLGMQTPDHWCHVPGRENTNLSLAEWKNFTIPREGASFSKCLMYNQSDGTGLSGRGSAVKCQDGWDYDNTWFSQTVPSQMNWVCDNQQPIKDVFFYAQNIGVALGLLVGYIGDMFGRRPQAFLCLAAHVVSRLMLVLTPHVLVLFILAESLVSAAAGPLTESVLAIGLELTDIRHRTAINRYMSCSMTVGMMTAGLVSWALADWNYSFIFAALSCFVLIFFFRWFPESPRWLACRGREQEALEVVRRIAATNGTTVPPFTSQVIQTVGKCKADRTGFLSVFSSWNVFRNTVILVIARSAHLLTMYSPLLAVSRLSVNPFLAVMVQGAAQFAAYFCVNYCAAKFGRRWSGVASALLAAVASAVLFCLLTVNIAGAAIMVVTMLMQFCSTGSNGMANLQSAELHPTCLRQIAASVEWGVAGIAMSALPYLALTNEKRVPFAVLTALNMVAAFSASFLPESALQRLPESLEDGAVFGKGQRYWSWKPKPPPE